MQYNYNFTVQIKMGTRLVGECRFFDSFDTENFRNGVSTAGQRIKVQFGILTMDNSA